MVTAVPLTPVTLPTTVGTITRTAAAMLVDGVVVLTRT
jgi:tRNA G18 (ribose-2'-O)-methylase SpoU